MLKLLRGLRNQVLASELQTSLDLAARWRGLMKEGALLPGVTTNQSCAAQLDHLLVAMCVWLNGVSPWLKMPSLTLKLRSDCLRCLSCCYLLIHRD
jgi:hypothetical protein